MHPTTYTRVVTRKGSQLGILLFASALLIFAATGCDPPGPTATKAQTPTATLTPTLTLTPTKSLPTRTPTPTPTKTAKAPTRTSPPTPTVQPPTRTPILLAPVGPPAWTPTHTPALKTVRPELTDPQLGREYQNPVAFKWNGSPGIDGAYQVTVYHPESGLLIQSELLTTQQWITNLPPARYGEWRWWVSVIGDGDVTSSSEWMFWFNPFPGAGAATLVPTPTCPCIVPNP